MFGIILSHYGVHGVYQSDTPTIYTMMNDGLSILGGIGVNLYAMVTAWFMWGKSYKRHRILTLIRDIYTYIIGGFIGFYLIYHLTGRFQHLFHAERVYNTLMPLGREYWYITAHILLLLYLPALNGLLEKLKRHQHRALNIALIALFTMTPMLGFPHNKYFKVVLLLPYLYSLTTYFKRYTTPSKPKARLMVLIGLIWSIGSILWFNGWVSYLPNLYGERRSYLHHEDPGILILSIGLFFLFFYWDAKYNKWIERVATTTLGIYLFHENPMIRHVLYKGVNNTQYTTSILTYIISALVFGVVIFFVGMMIDYLKQLMVDPITNRLINKWGRDIDDRSNH